MATCDARVNRHGVALVTPGEHHLEDVAVPVTVPGVIESSRKLSGVRLGLEPPVHPRELDADVAGRRERHPLDIVTPIRDALELQAAVEPLLAPQNRTLRLLSTGGGVGHAQRYPLTSIVWLRLPKT